MTRRGRSWTACLAAAIAAGGVASLVAAPPFPAESAQSQAGIPPASPSIEAPGGPAEQVQPNADMPVITPNGAPAAYVRSATTKPEPRPAQVFVAPNVAGWIAVTGAFQRQGSYELAGDSIALIDLIERCGGLTADASGRLRLVRNGKPFGTIDNVHAPLLPGDLLIAERQDAESTNDALAGSALDPQRDRIDCEVGIIGLTDRPLVVRIPIDYATVDGMLKLTGQTHLAPGEVAVLMGGQREMRGDEVTELSDSSVIVFDPLQVDAEAVANHPPRTNYFHNAAAPRQQSNAPIMRVAGQAVPEVMPSLAAPSQSSSSTSSPSMANSLVDDAASLTVDAEAPTELAIAPPTANVPPAAIDDGLTPLPPVEMLEPPAGEPQFRFPRVADRSGTTPIGKPEADSHILSVPADAFYPVDEPNPMPVASSNATAPTAVADSTALLAPAANAAPIDLSEAERTTETEELPFQDLLPTVLLGAVLGGLTFATLRWLRRRDSMGGLPSRLRTWKERRSTPMSLTAAAKPQPAAPQPMETGRTTLRPASEASFAEVETEVEVECETLSAGDLLAALVADRLTLREESVVLPMTQRLHGRSSAMKKRRLDVAAAETVPEPHLVLTATQSAAHDRESEVGCDALTGDRSSTGTRRRIDASATAAAEAALATGTPFERALAARHQSKRRGEG